MNMAKDTNQDCVQVYHVCTGVCVCAAVVRNACVANLTLHC